MMEPLSVTHPELCLEWSEKNYPFTPDEEVWNSVSKVWWVCPLGHEWQAPVRQRAEHKTGCPYCKRTKLLKGFNDLATLYPHLVPEWSEKNYPVLPDDIMPNSNSYYYWKCPKGHEWSTKPGNRVKGNGCPICNKEPVIQGVNDLATTHPELLEEWSDKNTIKPNDIKATYKKQIIWRCRHCGNEFICQPFTRLNSKRKCPHCHKASAPKFDNPTANMPIIENTLPDELRNQYRVSQCRPLKSDDVADWLKKGYMVYGKDDFNQHENNLEKINEVPIYQKYSLSVSEASELFSIGQKKMQKMVYSNKDAEWLVWEHGHGYIIREKFEEYLNGRHDLDE